jgi:hypothetical protein
MSELEIPDEACTAYIEASSARRREGDNGTAYVYGLRAAAPAIVAAELRRIAARFGTSGAALHLRDRADELDPR